MKRVFLLVLDSFGVGEALDADFYGDEGANTLRSILKTGLLNVPNMQNLGLLNLEGLPDDVSKLAVKAPMGAFAKVSEISKGKDTTTGHWEIAGVVTEKAFPTYPNGFPQSIIKEFSCKVKRGVICNKPYSGTKVINDYGRQHIETGDLIVYTSADSVLQIAAHEDVMSVSELHRLCKIAREIIDEKGYGIGTVIARPYVGTCSENFTRTYNRKDFEAEDFGKTMLDVFAENGKNVLSIGKIEDLFSGRSIKRSIHTNGNTDGIEKTIYEIKNSSEDLIFVNLVDFDMLYGHRNNIEGYAKALEEFDSKLPEIMENLRDDDILIITADHGNDPSTPSTDHSREYIPILIYGKNLNKNVDLGIRETYSDISATILDLFNLPKLENGTSFKNNII